MSSALPQKCANRKTSTRRIDMILARPFKAEPSGEGGTIPLCTEVTLDVSTHWHRRG